MMQNKDADRSKQIERYLGWAVLIVLLIGTFRVVKPFLSAAIWAAVFTFSLWPANRRLTKWLGGRRMLAALITTLTIALLLLVPFVILGFNLAADVRAVSTAVTNWSAKGPPQTPAWLEKIPLVGQQAKKYWDEAALESARFARQLTRAAEESSAAAAPADTNAPSTTLAPPADKFKMTEMLGKIIVEGRTLLLQGALAMGEGIVQVVLSLVLMLFMLCDPSLGDRFTGTVVRIAGERGRHLVKIAGDTVRGVIYGIIGTAIVQGAVAAIGFAIAGVPGPAFLGLLTFFLSPIPVGPPLVWIPASIWLFTHGHTSWGVFMLIWGLGVSTIDNFLKPWLISQGSHMPFLLIFFGVIGGALAFGFIGIFLGPSLLAVTYCLVDEWLGDKKAPVKK